MSLQKISFFVPTEHGDGETNSTLYWGDVCMSQSKCELTCGMCTFAVACAGDVGASGAQRKIHG
jgi:hypothetical protein